MVAAIWGARSRRGDGYGRGRRSITKQSITAQRSDHGNRCTWVVLRVHLIRNPSSPAGTPGVLNLVLPFQLLVGVGEEVGGWDHLFRLVLRRGCWRK